MFREEDFSDHNGIEKLLELYERAISKEGRLEDLDLIVYFFNPLRAEINQGRYDYKLVKAWYSATNLLNLKVQALLDTALQKKGLKKQKSSDTSKELLSAALRLSKSIRPLARPISKVEITKAYIELMIHRKKKLAYSSEPERMSYKPEEIEPISIEVDKDKLLQKIQAFKRISIDLLSLLKERTWQGLLKILNILLHLAHERKIKLHQDNFPEGKIIITYEGSKN